MWRCHKCGKPVYFAERRQSIGFDWHPWCLKCEECGKRLHPGQHAEHKGLPYCSIPCYSALFGPKLFGHGSRVESHRSFGQRAVSFMREQKTLQNRISDYNDYIERREGRRMGISYREVNGRLVLDGILRVYWGVDHSIRLKEFFDKRVISKSKKNLNEDNVSLMDENNFASTTDDDDEENHDSSSNETLLNNNNDKEISNSINNHTNGNENLTNNANQSVELKNPLVKAVIKRDSDKRKSMSHIKDESVTNKVEIKYSSLPSRTDERGYTALDLTIKTYPKKDLQLAKGKLGRAQPSFDIPCEVDSSSDGGSLEKLVKEKLHIIETDHKNNTANTKLNEEDKVRVVRGKGPRALKRRHGKKMDRNKVTQKSSINGHWYDRDTSVFTPPKGALMNVYTNSLLPTKDIIKMFLKKYQVDSEESDFALYVIKDNGERRLVKDHEFPLLLRVNLGPRDDIAKLYLMDKKSTQEIRHEVAQYLKFSYAECRAILNIFYEQEEAEVARIKYKYKIIKKRIKERMFDLRVRF